MQSDEEARLRTANRTKKTKRMLRRRIISKRELEFMKKKKKQPKIKILSVRGFAALTAAMCPRVRN